MAHGNFAANACSGSNKAPASVRLEGDYHGRKLGRCPDCVIEVGLNTAGRIATHRAGPYKASAARRPILAFDGRLIDPASVELRDFINAADEACGATTTAPEVEALRRARLRLVDSLTRTAREVAL